MRILIFSQQLAAFRSGVGTYTHALVIGLAQLGHQLTVVVPKGESLPLEGVRIITLPRPRFDPTPGAWLALGVFFARALAAEADYHDLAHFTDARESWRVRRASIPVVGMAHDSYALDWFAPDYPRNLFSDRFFRSFYYRMLRAVEKRTYRRLDAIIANSKHVAQAVVTGYGLAPSSAHVVHIGLPSPPPAPEIPLEGSPSILFVGGNFQRKGLNVLLEAASRLRKAHPFLRIHVVGKDRNQRALEARARDLGMADVVIFHGWQRNERVRGMMAGANLFALPSLTEGFGLVYLEAMQVGTPVVATSLGGAREVFEEGKAAFFVHPCDVDALVGGISKIASDPETAARLRVGGRAAAKRLTVNAMAGATEELFLQILDR